MGEPTPQPPEVGDDCNRCDNLLWLPDQTPKYLRCDFTDVVIVAPYTPPDPNRSFVCTQVVGDACIWQYQDADFLCVINQDTPNPCVHFGFYAPGFKSTFYSTPLTRCLNRYDNLYTPGVPGPGGHSGEVHVQEVF